MYKFRQISTELLPLIRVENWYPCSILRIFGLLPSNFVCALIFKRNWWLILKIIRSIFKECYWLVYHIFFQGNTEL